MSIEVKGITKRYGDNTALDNLSVSFDENKIYGLLGRNGAGKTTLLNIITGRIFPDSGSVLVDNESAIENDAVLKNLYIMSEKNYYPEKMKIRDAIKWSKYFYPDCDEEYAKKLAQEFGLDMNKQVRSLSTGYSSIFKLVLALSVNTPYVLLDEPVLGLDANHRELFYKTVLQKYSENPCCIIISTHLVEEVSGLIEDVVIIKNGRIIHNEPREELLSKGYTVAGSAENVDRYIEGKNVIGTDTFGGLKSAHILGYPDEKLPDNIEISRLDLQKLFVRLTND